MHSCVPLKGIDVSGEVPEGLLCQGRKGRQCAEGLQGWDDLSFYLGSATYKSVALVKSRSPSGPRSPVCKMQRVVTPSCLCPRGDPLG